MNEPSGNTLGLKPSELKHLRNTFRRRVSPQEIVSAELARHLTQFSRETNRQVGVLLSRKGEVEYVVVGNAHQLELPDIGRARAGQVRLRGLRLVHTHLKSEPLTRDDLTDLALLRLDLVAAVGVRDDGLPGVLHWAHLLPQNAGGELWRTETVDDVREQPDFSATVEALEDELAQQSQARRVSGKERAVLIAVCLDGRRADSEASLTEMKELARTAGVEVVDALLQVRRSADPKYLIGRGKLDELNLRAMQQLAEVLIFDQELSPSQARHLGEATSLKVLDRTQLILDIFAQRAQSGEGKLQVELAQLKYLMPRLVQADSSLSRLSGGGGVGGRGPGETKLELDRRRVRDRVALLEKKLGRLSTERRVRRRQRTRRELPVISIVGYTNAGKSTLLNALTKSDVLAEDKLFATLDPTSRRLRFPREHEVIITDTVGFIRDLPKDLVAAFRATLEELEDASLLLHVIDAADPARDAQVEAVEKILGQLELSGRPRLLVWNKADLLPSEEALALVRARGGVALSAKSRGGLGELLLKCEDTLFAEGDREHAEALRLTLAPAGEVRGEDGA
ncbi:MAG: GTPase HflX [Myxococcales bacterium]|nr:GTPase HflX [Myxococcales bacterium]